MRPETRVHRRFPILQTACFGFLVAATPAGAGGQPSWQFSGYLVDLPAYQRIEPAIAQLFGSEQTQALNLTRLRLRPTLFLWEGGRISLEHEVAGLYRSRGPVLLQSSLPARRQVADLRWDPVDGPRYQLAHFVDRLYFRQNFAVVSVVLGRQRISWGTGRVWNPTDLFNPINPASFDKIEKDGADAASVKYSFGSFTDLEAVYNAEDHFRRSNAGLRFRTNFAGYDMSVMAASFGVRRQFGGDFAGNLFDAGLRGEGLVAWDAGRSRSRFVKFILGIDYQFTARFYALIEYHFNGEGETEKGAYRVERLARGEILNLGRHYVSTGMTYQLHPLVVASIPVTVNLTDGSGFAAPSLIYSVSANTDATLGALLPYASTIAEYWYYPTSFYLKGSWYF